MPLPECYARREIAGERRRVYCLHPQVAAKGDIVPAELCKMCDYWREPPPAPLRSFPPPPVVENSGPCVYLGDQIGLRDCPTCRGHVRVKLFACTHPGHERTTLAECRRCSDHQPRGEGRTEEDISYAGRRDVSSAQGGSRSQAVTVAGHGPKAARRPSLGERFPEDSLIPVRHAL